MIEIKNLHKQYMNKGNNVKILDGIDLKIDKGEMVAIMGKSGSGKSTLLSILAGLESLDSGSYIIDNNIIDFNNERKLSELRRSTIGIIPQNYALIGHINVFDNIMLPLKYQKKNKNEVKQNIYKLLKNLELENMYNKYPNELSGGERQRVAIARSLIGNPEIIIADEPTSALDSSTEDRIMNMFINLNKSLGKTIIIATHNKKIAENCHRIFRLTWFYHIQ